MNHRLPPQRLSHYEAPASFQGFSASVNLQTAKRPKAQRPTLNRRRRAMVLLSECGVFLGLLVCVVYLASMWSVLNPFTGVLEAMKRSSTAVQASLLAEGKTAAVFMDVHVPE
jgi:hypothetical protein